jgi:glycerol-3-phosphate dehydrogenase
MLTVAGGKLTTYRRIALEALNALRSDLGFPRVGGSPAPLPGAVGLAEANARLATLHAQLDPALRAHLAHLYGSHAEDVLALASGDPHLFERLHPRVPDIAAQAVYAQEREWACTAEDVLRRRTSLALRGVAGPELVARVETLLLRAADVRG